VKVYVVELKAGGRKDLADLGAQLPRLPISEENIKEIFTKTS
jgi:hypothetical protein